VGAARSAVLLRDKDFVSRNTSTEDCTEKSDLNENFRECLTDQTFLVLLPYRVVREICSWPFSSAVESTYYQYQQNSFPFTNMVCRAEILGKSAVLFYVF